MAVYVDGIENYDDSAFTNPAARRYGQRWCHLFAGSADGIEELHQFAARLGLKRSWYQPAKRWQFCHYDLTPNKRALAVRLGAVEINARDRAQQTIAQIEEESAHGGD